MQFSVVNNFTEINSERPNVGIFIKLHHIKINCNKYEKGMKEGEENRGKIYS